ncbi:hypothetical protein I7I50_08449 [Histoplasma capsulatum G186AR]|uniref:Secreted protein n=1 Tax=Ajellomyces capsulatus TaxID=5037 RepID=A0A8H7YNI5_AJECA|nr:hypothetical protein I7I52_05964 [Histoplasma capsulatum]QSS73610.1 hypothetical protein I7I50_08449 [Histoplasma capsulatum G186AR]
MLICFRLLCTTMYSLLFVFPQPPRRQQSREQQPVGLREAGAHALFSSCATRRWSGYLARQRFPRRRFKSSFCQCEKLGSLVDQIDNRALPVSLVPQMCVIYNMFI